MRCQSAPDRRAVVLGLGALAATPATAHIGAHAGEIRARALRPERVDGNIEFSLIVINTTGQAVTLRGATCNYAQDVSMVRNRGLFGLTFQQKLDFVRIEPGEVLALARPDYMLTLVEADPLRRVYPLLLDFGPSDLVIAQIALRD